VSAALVESALTSGDRCHQPRLAGRPSALALPSDLFYACRFPIEIPSLENDERHSSAVEYFIVAMRENSGTNIKRSTRSARIAPILSLAWNIRELQNVIERSVLFVKRRIFL